MCTPNSNGVNNCNSSVYETHDKHQELNLQYVLIKIRVEGKDKSYIFLCFAPRSIAVEISLNLTSSD